MSGEGRLDDAGPLARLRAAGLVPKRSLGQNFLHDPGLLNALVDAAEISPAEAAFEVGTGPATLTRQLACRARRVLSVEVDGRLADFARRELDELKNVEILTGDILESKSRLNPLILSRLRNLGKFGWVSNLPYSVATPVILSVVEAGLPWTRCVLTLQLEVAERLSAPQGGPAYGSTTALVGFWARVRIIRRIARGSFWPRPRVDSAAILIEPRRPALDPGAHPAYRRWVRTLFRSRRKQLQAILRRCLGKDESARILSSTGWDPRRRPESLGVDDFYFLATNFPFFSH